MTTSQSLKSVELGSEFPCPECKEQTSAKHGYVRWCRRCGTIGIIANGMIEWESPKSPPTQQTYRHFP